MDRVVPVAVKAMPLEAYRRQLRIGDGDATRVLAAVEFRPNAESGPTVRRANEAHDRGQVDEWGAAPIHRDVREQPMLDLVPLARTRRKVTDRDHQARPIGQTLQFPLPHLVTIQGQRRYLWRAVDQDGDVIDILVQSRRDCRVGSPRSLKTRVLTYRGVSTLRTPAGLPVPRDGARDRRASISQRN